MKNEKLAEEVKYIVDSFLETTSSRIYGVYKPTHDLWFSVNDIFQGSIEIYVFINKYYYPFTSLLSFNPAFIVSSKLIRVDVLGSKQLILEHQRYHKLLGKLLLKELDKVVRIVEKDLVYNIEYLRIRHLSDASSPESYTIIYLDFSIGKYTIKVYPDGSIYELYQYYSSPTLNLRDTVKSLIHELYKLLKKSMFYYKLFNIRLPKI